MTRSLTPSLTALAAAVCLAGAAAAQPGQTSEGAQRQMTGQATGAKQATADNKGDTAKAGSTAASKLSRGDRDFLEKAAHAGHTEVEGSKLALTKATSPEVKQFAQQMVDDHTKAGDELKQLADSKGVKVPTEPAIAQKAKLKVLSGRSGAGFDSDYAEEVGVKAHADTVKLFQKAAQDAQDADVKAFAQKTLPTLQHHLQMAQTLHTTMSAKAPTPGSKTMSGSGTAPSNAGSAPASGK